MATPCWRRSTLRASDEQFRTDARGGRP
jgi:hypothetical protein